MEEGSEDLKLQSRVSSRLDHVISEDSFTSSYCSRSC